MMQWFTLLNKELLEMWRNFKWVWVPISFILLGVMNPLSTYYLPQILESVGGLPEGAKFEIPEPKASEILIMSLGDFSTLGVLIIALTTMGIIASERKSGVVELILVKPVSYTSYVTAKWTSALILLWLSFFIGYLTSWYYVGILFEQVPFMDFFKSFLIYGTWFSFIVTVTVFFSGVFKTPGMAGFVSLALIIVLNLVSSSLSHIFEWSPAQLTSYANELLILNKFSSDIFPAVGISLTGMIALLAACILILRKKELAS